MSLCVCSPLDDRGLWPNQLRSLAVKLQIVSDLAHWASSGMAFHEVFSRSFRACLNAYSSWNRAPESTAPEGSWKRFA